MGDKPLPPGLHVILGDSAAGTFRRAFRVTPDCLDVDRDVLSCGPTPACESLRAWAVMRTAFWNSMPRDADEGPYPVMDIAERADRLREAPRINLWMGTGLSEQLSAACTIHLAEAGAPAPDKFHVVLFERLREGPEEAYGLGLLNEERLGAHPRPRLLSDNELRHFRALWTALTSSDPTSVQGYCAAHPDASPWLRRATKLLMRRFPDITTGLTFWDHALLAECTVRSKKAARIIGDTMGKNSGECDPVGDLFLFGRLMALGANDLPKPLLTIFGAGTHMRYTEVALTPFGIDILEGRASNYPTNPVDDWAAGVRLSSRDGNLWFNDNETLVRAS